MNVTQKNYARARVNSVLEQKIKALKNTAKPNEDMTEDEEYEQVISGKAKLKTKEEIDDTSRYHGTLLGNVYIFCKKENTKRYKRELKVYDTALEKFNIDVGLLSGKALALIDEIFLGDSAAALKMLTDFEKN